MSPNKKTPAEARVFLQHIQKSQSAAAGTAASAAAGTAAAPPAAAQGLGRGDTETGTGSGLDEVYLDDSTLIAEIIIQEELNSAMLKGCIIFFWLIQSQSQRGACSATLHQRNTYGRFDIIIGQVRFQFNNRLLCYFKHPMISSSKGS